MKVLLIEDNDEIAEMITACFSAGWPGTTVLSATRGLAALEVVGAENPDIVILDISSPGVDALELMGQVQDAADIPVIMVSDPGKESELVRGLEEGAADYIVKPLRPLELLARTRAVLRRAQMWPLSASGGLYCSGKLSVNFDSREVHVNREPVSLTPTQFKLLAYMVNNPGHLLTRRTLLERVWGGEYVDFPSLLKIQIHHLRRKLQDDPQNPRIIVTQRGRGYVFQAP